MQTLSLQTPPLISRAPQVHLQLSALMLSVFAGNVVTLSACSHETHPPSPVSTTIEDCQDAKAPAPPKTVVCDPNAALSDSELRFDASPAGVPEVSAAWVAANHCKVHLVDVRARNEMQFGRMAGIDSVPLGELGRAMANWNPRHPVVFVCRSGRRSGRAVHVAETMGFTHAASMTGGMLAWSQSGYPVSTTKVAGSNRPTVDTQGPPTASTLQAVLDNMRVRRVRTAAMLLSGSESCVDGRENDAVIGTPGGDAGELLLALSTIESLTHRDFSTVEIRALFTAYVGGFGRFYMHTDEHALHHLSKELAADPRFRGRIHNSLEAFLRMPPPDLQGALLEHLLTADNIGCGHLRLMSLHPDEYKVRPALLEHVLQVVFEALWRTPADVDFVVLHGEHSEEAVLNVRFPGTVHTFTNVPAIPPKLGSHSFFVNHPQVAAFLRGESVHFFFETTTWLSDAGVSRAAYTAALNDQADLQLGATLHHLAADLPVFDVIIEPDDALSVRNVSGATPK